MSPNENVLAMCTAENGALVIKVNGIETIPNGRKLMFTAASYRAVPVISVAKNEFLDFENFDMP